MYGIGPYSYSHLVYFGNSNSTIKPTRGSTAKNNPYAQLPKTPEKKSESLAERYLNQELSKQVSHASKQQPKQSSNPDRKITRKIAGPITVTKENEWWQSYKVQRYTGKGQWTTISQGGERINFEKYNNLQHSSK